jgi:hypothetical protein
MAGLRVICRSLDQGALLFDGPRLWAKNFQEEKPW